jgi:hypothetical protein
MSFTFRRRSTSLRVLLSLLICGALLLIPCAPFAIKGKAWCSNQDQLTGARPEPGAAAASLPDLEDVRHRQHLLSFSQTMQKQERSRVLIATHHVVRNRSLIRAAAAFTITKDQYIQNFLSMAPVA